MYNYQDYSGIYFGEILDGYPHGKGQKTYNFVGLSYEGEWKLGRKHGRGIITTIDYAIDLEFKDGVPTKVYRLIKPENNKAATLNFELPITSVRTGNHYTEILDLHSPKIYIFYCNLFGQMYFEGKIFETKLKNIKIFSHEFLEYFGESKNSYPQGFAQIDSDCFTYIGFNNNLILEGQGIKKFRTGCIYKGEFKKSMLNGEGEIINEKGSIKGVFKDNFPYGDALITYYGKTEKIFLEWNGFLLNMKHFTINKNSSKQIMIVLKSFIKIEDCVFEYNDGEVRCLKKSLISNELNHEQQEFNFNFKEFKSWKDFEARKKNKQNIQNDLLR